ncbi:DUF1223 domain-containing protein [Parendozoicomonas sp. Alg238-R29]|uniref:DUF1223 domain-containing protein n=1 Tax=Parendozoicomonas sp. Alg238-R29 TaxID=2993446 RepID=UPI00248E2C4C|nr:DUF1223 domain-containing protein [Parendozoicomonas sp. Alg238-R29]
MGLLKSFLVPLVLSVPLTVQAATISLDSGERQNRLLELFTSEGCSSCPPADAFLSELKEDKKLWNPWVPVAFHVGYWDYLGWKDVFAQPKHQERQYAYRKAERSRGVYTPGFFINGQEWRGFFNLFRSLPDYTPAPAGRLRAEIEGGQLKATFSPLPSEAGNPGGFILHWALTGSGRVTKVQSGENARRTLPHDFVALASGTLNSANLSWSADLSVESYEGPLALSLWVTPRRDPFEVIQATGGWLSTP